MSTPPTATYVANLPTGGTTVDDPSQTDAGQLVGTIDITDNYFIADVTTSLSP